MSNPLKHLRKNKTKLAVFFLCLFIAGACKKDGLTKKDPSVAPVTLPAATIEALSASERIKPDELITWMESSAVKKYFPINESNASERVIGGQHVIVIPMTNDASLFITKEDGTLKAYGYRWKMKPGDKTTGTVLSFSFQDNSMRTLTYNKGRLSKMIIGADNEQTAQELKHQVNTTGQKTNSLIKAVAHAACTLLGGDWDEFNWDNPTAGPFCWDWFSYFSTSSGQVPPGYIGPVSPHGPDNSAYGTASTDEYGNVNVITNLDGSYYFTSTTGDGLSWVNAWTEPDRSGCPTAASVTNTKRVQSAPATPNIVDPHGCDGVGYWRHYLLEIQYPDGLSTFISPDPNLPVTVADNSHLNGQPADALINGAPYYSKEEAFSILTNLNNESTDDPIMLYLIANYKGSSLLDLSRYNTSGLNYHVGDYYLTPNFSADGVLLFYSAWRNPNNGIEYLIQPSAMADFIKKYKLFLAAANLVYLNGRPSEGMIKLMAGNYAGGLKDMWGDALTDPVYLTNLAVAFVVGSAPASKVTFVTYENVTFTPKSIPNFQIGITLDEFEINLSRNTKSTWMPVDGTSGNIKNLYRGNFKYTSRRGPYSNSGPSVDVVYKDILQVKYRLN